MRLRISFNIRRFGRFIKSIGDHIESIGWKIDPMPYWKAESLLEEDDVSN